MLLITLADFVATSKIIVENKINAYKINVEVKL